MRLYDVLLFVHVLAAAVWIGGGIALVVIATQLSRTDEPARALRFMHETDRASNTIFIPSVLVVLAAGFGLIYEGGWGYPLWIVLALAGFGVTFATGMFVLGPTSSKLVKLAEERGYEDAEVVSASDGLLFVARFDMGVIVAVLALMALKPGTGDAASLALVAAIPVAAAALSLWLRPRRGGIAAPVLSPE